MSSLSKKWLLALVALCLLPATLTAKPKYREDRCRPAWERRCRAVPEGGSGLVYLLGAGITCAGAVLIRSRLEKAEDS